MRFLFELFSTMDRISGQLLTNAVRRVIDKVTEMDTSWPLDFSMTNGALEKLLFPSDKSVTDRRLPAYDYIRKELLRNSVTKKLL